MKSTDFYSSLEYRTKQSKITKANWKKGKFDFLRKQVTRTCEHEVCTKTFRVILSSSKKYCSSSCAAKTNNLGRVLSAKSKKKISVTLTGTKHPNRLKLPGKTVRCGNLECQKLFTFERWRKLQYCSNKCAMKVIGGKPTSPKAARGKAGIRSDIDSKIYFYSRWEANYARILNLLGNEWVHQPKTFRLKR